MRAIALQAIREFQEASADYTIQRDSLGGLHAGFYQWYMLLEGSSSNPLLAQLGHPTEGVVALF